MSRGPVAYVSPLGHGTSVSRTSSPLSSQTSTPTAQVRISGFANRSLGLGRLGTTSPEQLPTQRRPAQIIRAWPVPSTARLVPSLAAASAKTPPCTGSRAFPMDASSALRALVGPKLAAQASAVSAPRSEAEEHSLDLFENAQENQPVLPRPSSTEAASPVRQADVKLLEQKKLQRQLEVE
eukprot:g7359.t1